MVDIGGDLHPLLRDICEFNLLNQYIAIFCAIPPLPQV
jgi:hypothetical protein